MGDLIFFGPMFITCLSPLLWIVLYYKVRKYKTLLLVFRINLGLYVLLLGTTLVLVLSIHDLGAFICLAYGCMAITAHMFIALIGFNIWKAVIERKTNG